MKLVVHLPILFLCLLVFFLQNCRVSSQCRDHEQQALLELKNSFFNFSPVSGIASWRSNIDCCRWKGIICNKYTGKVASIDISNSSIIGDGVSSRIFALGDLEVLNLAYNDFNCSIPSGLDRFSKLTHLNLSNSGFAGQIPLEISTLTSLVSLDLSSNNGYFYYGFSSLKLENPNLSTLIGNLTNLKHLDLATVNISFQVPISLNKLSSLEYLNLRGCGLSGEFPKKVFSFRNITNIHISDNPDLEVVLPELPKNSFLRSLKLSSTNLSWMSVASLSKLDSLTRLDVSNCDISGYLPYWTSTLRSLVYLDMSSNHLVGDIHSLENLTELVYLDLSNNNFMSGLRHMKKLSQLSELYLQNNKFNEDSSTFRREFENLINITYLNLSDNKFTGEISFIDNLTRLNFLRISNNSFSGSIPRMENHQDILRIYMSDNDLSGSMPSLSSSKNLIQIILSSNHLDGKIPRSYSNFSNLWGLSASGNLIEGPIPFSLFYLPSIEILDLSDNRLNIITEEENINVTDANLYDLDLSSNNLKGQIPSFLLYHPSLWYLDLRNNSLSGITDENNTNTTASMLMDLDLSSNNLNGPIPFFIFNHPFLSTLNLRDNNLSVLTKDINLNMTSSELGYLYLGSNHLKGPIPKWIFQLKNLKSLYLEYNNFNDRLDLQLFSILPNLTDMDLSDNNLLLVNPSSNFTLQYFNKIEYLALRNCKLTEFPSFLRNKGRLYYLDLSKNNISGKIPNWIWNAMSSSFTSLSLNLSYNMLEGFKEPRYNTSSLRFFALDLSNNNFSKESFEILGFNLSGARLISVANNKIFGKIPESICNAPSLVFLDLSQNHLSGTIPQCIGEMMGNLGILRLQNNKFHGKMPQSYGKDCNLRTLNLNGNQLEGDIPRSLENCTELVVLDLGNNQLSGTFPFWLESLTVLRVLVLRSNKFYGGINFTYMNYIFPSLRIMDISSNSFTGTISLNWLQGLQTPSEKDNSTHIIGIQMGSSYYRESVTLVIKHDMRVIEKILDVFTSVDLSNNNFGGEIPKDVGELKLIRLLNISGNHLIGSIPPSIGNLTLLESLDLSLNNLSGRIPLELTSLTYLSALNLSMNNFEGRIPERNQFSTFTEKSFLGNPRLCGPPLQIKCSDNFPSYMGREKRSSGSFIETLWFTFPFGFVPGLIIGVLVGILC